MLRRAGKSDVYRTSFTGDRKRITDCYGHNQRHHHGEWPGASSRLLVAAAPAESVAGVRDICCILVPLLFGNDAEDAAQYRQAGMALCSCASGNRSLRRHGGGERLRRWRRINSSAHSNPNPDANANQQRHASGYLHAYGHFSIRDSHAHPAINAGGAVIESDDKARIKSFGGYESHDDTVLAEDQF